VDVAAVGLQLRFAGALGADGTLAAGARLPLQMRPHADQARQQILVLRQLHLQAALLRLGALGEDVEDEPAAVEHLHAEFIGQYAHLGGREVIVEDDHGRLLARDQLLDLGDLALADEGARIRRGKRLQHDADALAARRLDQRLQLAHALLVGVFLFLQPRRGKSDKDRPVARRFGFCSFHMYSLYEKKRFDPSKRFFVCISPNRTSC